ncbi:MAG: LysM peptidoglycan-binding domain-containing protein [Candidatus Electrothrix sp. AW1]|nr:LysM peptidoglycan-binding domain-containing protein [Candidatus Electrothrix sp. AX1]MCI5183296.1 LysM peptidoglycan-binding domain-containing protein [Candidatus Electrothrix gigas]
MLRVTDSRNRNFTLSKDITGGGEARIWSVQGKPQVVAKIYHNTPAKNREEKLKAMVANPPKQPKTHTAIAWPLDLLYSGKKFVGFLMPNISGNEPLFYFYNPKKRNEIIPGFNWKYLHRTAFNFVVAAEAVHTKGHLIGDINESNLLVNANTLVSIVDTDSFQIRDKQKIFRCPVGKPEFTPPELQGINFKDRNRMIEHDLFGIGIVIFRLLMEGYHPFAGIIPSGRSVGRVDLYCIQQGVFPYQQNSSVTPPPAAPLFNTLHPKLQKLFIRCFSEGHSTPSKRPTTTEWKKVLNKAEKSLKICFKDRNHLYYNQLKKCPWCIKMSAQKPLPPPKFSQKPASSKRGQKLLLLLFIIIVGIVYMPTDKSFFLSLKKRSAALWHESIVNYSIYTVRPGDSLSKIAHKYGVSVPAIVSANKSRYPSLAKNPNNISPGWKLKIPRQQ